MNHLTNLNDLTPTEVQALIDRAIALKAGAAPSGRLRGKTLGMVFLNPSLRTRTSFEVAMLKHGGHAIALTPGQGTWALEFEPEAVMDGDRPEHVIEAARVLSRYVDVLGVRAFSRGLGEADDENDIGIRAFRKHATVPVISLESAREHPFQGLADLMTAQERFGQTKKLKCVLTWAPHMKPLPKAVPNSFLLTAAALGAEITVAHPKGYELSKAVQAEAAKLAASTGGSVRYTNKQSEALEGAQVICAKAWGPSGLHAPAPNHGQLRTWRLEQAHFERTDPQSIFLHCLPVRRDVEVGAAVLDGPRAAIYDEAENRMWAQMAGLEWVAR
jgi:N-acetylornithine carbamoyltransferase